MTETTTPFSRGYLERLAVYHKQLTEMATQLQLDYSMTERLTRQEREYILVELDNVITVKNSVRLRMELMKDRKRFGLLRESRHD